MSKDVEWFGSIQLARILAITENSEKASAERIFADAKNNCPVGEWERTGTGGKSWKARRPGSLKESIQLHKSKYKDGGYAVSVGNDDIFYASFVELGIPSRNIHKKAFMRNAAKKESRRFYRKLKAMLE
jgi:hypothetical protein